MPTVTLRITNAYDDGTEVVTLVKTVVPALSEHADFHDWDEWDAWAEEHLFPHTGTGKADGNSGYTVAIIDSDQPPLVGRTFDFGY